MKGNAAAKTPEEYVAGLVEPRRQEIAQLDRLIRETATQLEPIMIFGMLGYGPYRYKYESGREGDGARICLASQKGYISLYVSCAEGGEYLAERYKDRLAKADIGKSCVRFKRVTDVDLDVIRELIGESLFASKVETS